MTFKLARRARAVAVLAGLGALLTPFVPSPAHAYFRGGVFVGVPFFPFAPPPVVVAPPPVVYAPPPVYYAPPPAVAYAPPPEVGYAPPPVNLQPVPGRTCFAGSYTCPLSDRYPPGAGCSCPTGRGNAYGRAG